MAFLVALVVALTSAGPAGAVANDLVVNGSFEQPYVDGGFGQFGSIPGWFSGGPDPLIEVDGTIWQAFDGSQSADLNPNQPGSVYQDLATTPGRSYVLSLAQASHPQCGPAVTSIAIYWGATLVDAPSHLNTYNTADMGWVPRTYTVTATSSTTRLTIASGVPFGSCGPVVDDVSVTPVPLPTSADQCKDDGWVTFGVFKNQGDCVSFVATGGKNQPAG